ncbi:MAG: amidase domain-containing protein [Patescibacteria group bacterium]|nr:amidase domain-containing protein [Patescibacteria group bacterium]
MLVAIAAVPAAAYTYNRQAAADYALNNAYKNVPGSWHFRDNGGDCTNFVSHSLKAGGWREIGGWSHTSDDVWFYDYPYRYGYSHTWTHADKFYHFMSRTSRANPVSVKRNSYLLQVGDVVQIDYKDRYGNYGSWDHTMIVTAKAGNKLFMSYHTKDTGNRALSAIRQESPNARFIGWHIHNNYNY